MSGVLVVMIMFQTQSAVRNYASISLIVLASEFRSLNELRLIYESIITIRKKRKKKTKKKYIKVEIEERFITIREEERNDDSSNIF